MNRPQTPRNVLAAILVVGAHRKGLFPRGIPKTGEILWCHKLVDFARKRAVSSI
jgi:hypothetical protein